MAETLDLLADLDLPDPLAGMIAQDIEHVWPQMLVDVLNLTRDALVAAGATPDQARHAAIVMVRTMANYNGGRSVYLPRGQSLDDAIRDHSMYSAWSKGAAIADLMREHTLTEQCVYRIIARERELHRKKVQPGLFDSAKTNPG